jgi:hypothetical protein
MNNYTTFDNTQNPLNYYDTLKLNYPPNSIGFNTLTKPSTFTDYCFEPQCATVNFPYNLYSASYTEKLNNKYINGLDKYMSSRQIESNNVLTDNNGRVVKIFENSPVFNSNMTPLPVNFLLYKL